MLVLQDIAKQVRTYLIWRTIVNIGLAVVLGCFYKFVIGMSQPWTWALLTAILWPRVNIFTTGPMPTASPKSYA